MSETDLELRPDRRAVLTLVAVALLAGAGIAAAILAGDAPTVFAPIVGAVFAAMAALGLATLYFSRIVLTPDELLVRGPFSRQRRPRAHVAQVIRATIILPRGATGESLFLLDAKHEPLIRISGGSYKREDIDRLVDALGVPCDGPSHPIPGKEFAETYPGLISVVERHPYRIAFAAAGTILTALIALIVISLATAS